MVLKKLQNVWSGHVSLTKCFNGQGLRGSSLFVKSDKVTKCRFQKLCPSKKMHFWKQICVIYAFGNTLSKIHFQKNTFRSILSKIPWKLTFKNSLCVAIWRVCCNWGSVCIWICVLVAFHLCHQHPRDAMPGNLYQSNPLPRHHHPPSLQPPAPPHF